MKSVVINLNMAESVKQFVNIVSSYDFDVDLRQGKFVVNAKSILGIFSLDLNKPVIIEIFAGLEEAEKIIDELDAFVVK